MNNSENRLSPTQVEQMRQDMQRVLEAAEMDFEKKLLLISTGALTLSVGFIEKIVPLAAASHTCLLFFGWGLLIICLAVNLISQLYSAYAIKASIKELNEVNEDRAKNVDRRNCITMVMNIASVVALLAGVISIVVFAGINSKNGPATSISIVKSAQEIVPDSTQKTITK